MGMVNHRGNQGNFELEKIGIFFLLFLGNRVDNSQAVNNSLGIPCCLGRFFIIHCPVASSGGRFAIQAASHG